MPILLVQEKTVYAKQPTAEVGTVEGISRMTNTDRPWYQHPEPIRVSKEQQARIAQAGADAFADLLARIDKGEIRRAKGQSFAGTWMGR